MRLVSVLLLYTYRLPLLNMQCKEHKQLHWAKDTHKERPGGKTKMRHTFPWPEAPKPQLARAVKVLSFKKCSVMQNVAKIFFFMFISKLSSFFPTVSGENCGQYLITPLILQLFGNISREQLSRNCILKIFFWLISHSPAALCSTVQPTHLIILHNNLCWSGFRTNFHFSPKGFGVVPKDSKHKADCSDCDRAAWIMSLACIRNV